MEADGWYYLHANGELIYKGSAYTNVADFRESDLVRAFWPVEPDDREKAWTMLVEALAAGAKPERVRELAEKWGCDDDDAQEYARRIDVSLVRVEVRPGDERWGATAGGPVIGSHEQPIGTGETCLDAMADLAKALGYRPSKMWGASFGQLASGPAPIPERCPTCSSSAPHLHPAVQFEGEVQPCADPFHAIVTPRNTPERITATEALHDRAAS